MTLYTNWILISIFLFFGNVNTHELNHETAFSSSYSNSHSHSHTHTHSYTHSNFPINSIISNYLPNFITIWSLSLQNYLKQSIFIWSNRYNSMLATLIIQLLPFSTILLLIKLKFNLNSSLIRILLIPFAFGTLLSDILLHLLPECNAYNLSSSSTSITTINNNNNNNNNNNGIGIFLGILSFVTIDQVVRIFSTTDTHLNDKNIDNSNHNNNNHSSHSHSHIHLTSEKDNNSNYRQLNASIILNIIFGLLHNITDGIAVSSSFYSSKEVGIITVITMLFHEIPHQLSDFVILLSNGVSIKSCLITHFFTILSSLIGTVFGCYLNEIGSSSSSPSSSSFLISTSLLLPMITGGLIYISMVSILPEFITESQKDKQDSKTKRLFKVVLQISSTIIGFITIAIM